MNKDLNLNVVDICPKCRGSRCELGYKATTCTHCNGTGMETVSRGTVFKISIFYFIFNSLYKS